MDDAFTSPRQPAVSPVDSVDHPFLHYFPPGVVEPRQLPFLQPTIEPPETPWCDVIDSKLENRRSQEKSLEDPRVIQE